MWVGRGMGWGQQCGMLFLRRGGWVEGYPHQVYHSNTAKRQSSIKATVPFYAGQYVCKLTGRVGTASFVLLVCLSGET